jgi:hypothetical protein
VRDWRTYADDLRKSFHLARYATEDDWPALHAKSGEWVFLTRFHHWTLDHRRALTFVSGGQAEMFRRHMRRVDLAERVQVITVASNR